MKTHVDGVGMVECEDRVAELWSEYRRVARAAVDASRSCNRRAMTNGTGGRMSR